MSKEKEVKSKELAREILKKGILDMSVERLIQMTRFGLTGNINTFVGMYGSTHYFNRMTFLKAKNEEEMDLLEYSFVNDSDDVIASSFICIDYIEEISGCVNVDHPDDVLDICIKMEDDSEITINVVY